tara:strand:+ start:34398 stop:35207 length:810 start_codon:yes stop_codon:yes gene_type:complete
MGQQTKQEAVMASIFANLAKGGRNARPVYYDGELYESAAQFIRSKRLGVNNIGSYIKKGEFQGLPIFYIDSEKSLELKLYNSSVKIAKQLIGDMEAIQYKVALLAYKSCTIRHGGRSPGIYTILKFANDVGINPKTLSGWINVFVNVAKKLESPPTTRKEWSAAGRVNNRLTEHNRQNNLENNTPKSKSRSSVSNDAVRAMYDEESEGMSSIHQFQQFISYIKQMKYKLKKRNFSDVDIRAKKELTNLMEETFEAVDDDYRKALTGAKK